MNIVITGASKGIGREVVKGFARSEGNSIIAISRSEDLLDSLKEECNIINPNARIITIVCDLCDNIENVLIPKIKSYFDSLDIVINNAGFLINKPFESSTIKDIRTVFDNNVFAPALLIKYLLPLLKKANNAHVINISSMGGLQGTVKFPGLSIYSASKAALTVLTECLAEEYKDHSVSFNCLALGAVQTEMLAKAFPNYNAPLNAEQMADFIIDFAQKGNLYFNGKVIPVSLSTP